AVQAHTRDAKDGELDGEDVSLPAARVVARRAVDGGHLAVRERLRVEARGFEGVLVEPETDGVLRCHDRCGGRVTCAAAATPTGGRARTGTTSRPTRTGQRIAKNPGRGQKCTRRGLQRAPDRRGLGFAPTDGEPPAPPRTGDAVQSATPAGRSACRKDLAPCDPSPRPSRPSPCCASRPAPGRPSSSNPRRPAPTSRSPSRCATGTGTGRRSS